MRDFGRTTSLGKFQGILQTRDRFRAVSEKRPTSRYFPQQIGAIFETAAANNAGAITAIRQSLQGCHQPVAIYGTHEIDADMATRFGQGILITETVSD